MAFTLFGFMEAWKVSSWMNFLKFLGLSSISNENLKNLHPCRKLLRKKPTGMNFLKVWKKSEWYIEWDSERRPRTYVFSYEINSLQRRTYRNLLRKKPNYWLNLNFSISRFYFLPLRLGRSRSYLRLTNPSSSFEVVRVVVYRASHSPISRQTRDIDV